MIYNQLIKFIISGFAATLVHGVIFIYAVKVDIPPLVSNTFAYILALIVSFLIQSKWVFNVTMIEKIYLLKFGITSIIGFLLNTLIVFIAMNFFNKSEYITIVIMVTITPIVIFILNKFWVFICTDDQCDNS